MCSTTWETHILSDMCSPAQKTHIPSDMCSSTKDTHILSDNCFPTQETHIPSDMCTPCFCHQLVIYRKQKIVYLGQLNQTTFLIYECCYNCFEF